MKKARVTVPPAAAILAGGVFFTGPASAAIIFSEDFEGGVNAFAMPTYNYSQDYTLPNAGGGLVYGHGGAGNMGAGNAATNLFAGGNVNLTGVVSAAQIDAGLGAYNFSGDFSTWTMQGDWAELSVTFMDATNSPIGSPVLVGGEVFSAALAAGPNAKYTDAREWGTDFRTGIIPAGARSVDIVVTSTKTPDGLNTDGYVDNIVLDVSAVPEPATVSLAGLAGLLLVRRRR